jgi:hypothetical protein
MTNMTNKKQLGCALATLAVGAALSAHATIAYQVSNGGLESANVSLDSVTYDGILAGGIQLTQTGGSGGPSSYISICTDFLGSLYLGNTYTFNSPVSVSSANLVGVGLDPVWGADNFGKTALTADATSAQYALQNAAQIFANNMGVLNTGTLDQKAALQLAVWDALYDTTSSGLITGTRFGFDGSSAAGGIAEGWLTGLENPSDPSYVSPNIGLLMPSPALPSNGNNPDGSPPQELLVAPVPEASTVIAGMFSLLPLGLWGIRSMRKS